MPKYFPGITHAIVRTTHCKADMDAMDSTLGFVDLYFGPGNISGIKSIAIKTMKGPTLGIIAKIPNTCSLVNGRKEWTPVVTGESASELKTLALVAFDKIKSAKGLKFNKIYCVTGNIIEEIGVSNAECSTGLGQPATT